MQGKIVKGISGFYYVDVVGSGIYECKARGVFRKDKIKPLVGDMAEIEITDEEALLGNVIKILPRKSELRRPACANVDQALIIFSCDKPEPNFVVLDKMLIMMEANEVPQIICFNKMDLVSEERKEELRNIYAGTGCTVLFTNMVTGEGTESLFELLKGKTTVVTGPSGTGKSSFSNRFQKEVRMEVGSISKKLKRGKNTTRHAELLAIEGGGYIMDTPGFTSFDQEEIQSRNLKYFYPEFEKYEGKCRFNGCVHMNEPDCAVKNALIDNFINKTRYENYSFLYNELVDIEKRRYL